MCLTLPDCRKDLAPDALDFVWALLTHSADSQVACEIDRAVHQALCDVIKEDMQRTKAEPIP